LPNWAARNKWFLLLCLSQIVWMHCVPDISGLLLKGIFDFIPWELHRFPNWSISGFFLQVCPRRNFRRCDVTFQSLTLARGDGTDNLQESRQFRHSFSSARLRSRSLHPPVDHSGEDGSLIAVLVIETSSLGIFPEENERRDFRSSSRDPKRAPASETPLLEDVMD